MSSDQYFNPKQICILGIGNSLRGDDAIGQFICTELEKSALPSVEILVSHQLHIELVERLKGFGTVIIVDASMDGEDLNFIRLEGNKTSSNSSSHAIDAGLLYNLSQELFPGNQQFYLCAVRGTQFEMGKDISPKAKKNAGDAVKLILSFIKNNNTNS